ncbi:hypothetical protein BDB00DRAFT_969215 [Zychaea mexicana]|uniref:uncharacterized protein n=1 Tax=Zychaea mexicana TaxID=64656 RepID=UPI0022FE3865|nr:uncharacterized protein BDB00DRAFT_969215 [Zychaea mexicana]KAI9498202.1 hypothetical protein BDB00DRAFT_969215 [Zychaea mexicana]
MISPIQNVVSDPKLLNSFESFLRSNHTHHLEYNLLFVEAMSQLRHENESKKVEAMLHRVYDTFLAPRAKLKLKDVTTSEQVLEDINALSWCILSNKDAAEILKDTEQQVLATLTLKLDEFSRVKNMSILKSTAASPPSPDARNRNDRRIRVMIIGGGFTGFTVASILDRMSLFHITLIDTKDSFEYTPGIVKRIVHPEGSSSMRVRHDAYVQNGKVIIGYAEDIGHDARSVTVNDETIFFDYLVIATGSSYTSELKSTDVSSLYRLFGLDQVNSELVKAKRVLIVGNGYNLYVHNHYTNNIRLIEKILTPTYSCTGGGLVGCELAAEIASSTFPGQYPKKQVTLVESLSALLSRSDAGQQVKAMTYLTEELDVEVVCNERIIDITDGGAGSRYVGSSGREYNAYDKVFMATGTRPHSGLLRNATNDPLLDTCVDGWGHIQVKPTLQIEHWKYRHLFAGGDVTNVVEEKTGYAATLAGVCIARNICRLVKGKAPLRQGTKGTLPAPDKPLHGIVAQDVQEDKLTVLKKHLKFLNPSWAALKRYDEQQYLEMVQGESATISPTFGRLPRRLTLPDKQNHVTVALLNKRQQYK